MADKKPKHRKKPRLKETRLRLQPGYPLQDPEASLSLDRPLSPSDSNQEPGEEAGDSSQRTRSSPTSANLSPPFTNSTGHARRLSHADLSIRDEEEQDDDEGSEICFMRLKKGMHNFEHTLHTGLTSSSEDLRISDDSTELDDSHKQRRGGKGSLEGKEDLLKVLSDMSVKLLKLDALETMMLGFKGEFLALQARVGEISSSVSSMNTDLKNYDEKWQASASALSERVSKAESEMTSLGNKWARYQNDISKSLSVVQESADANSKKLIESEASSKNIPKIQEGLNINSNKIEDLQVQSNKFSEKWAALDLVESRVKTVAEDKFSLLKDALKSDLTEDLSMKVTTIQNTASNSLSEGFKGLKAQLKREILEELGETQSKVPTPKYQAVNNTTNNQPKSKQPHQFSKLKEQAYAKRHNLIFFGLPEGFLQTTRYIQYSHS